VVLITLSCAQANGTWRGTRVMRMNDCLDTRNRGGARWTGSSSSRECSYELQPRVPAPPLLPPLPLKRECRDVAAIMFLQKWCSETCSLFRNGYPLRFRLNALCARQSARLEEFGAIKRRDRQEVQQRGNARACVVDKKKREREKGEREKRRGETGIVLVISSANFRIDNAHISRNYRISGNGKISTI